MCAKSVLYWEITVKNKTKQQQRVDWGGVGVEGGGVATGRTRDY